MAYTNPGVMVRWVADVAFIGIGIFDFGNIYYRQKNYKKAATQYENALQLEKQKTSLPRNIGIVLVDQLGMSHGISGDFGEIEANLRMGRHKGTRVPTVPATLARRGGRMALLRGVWQGLFRAVNGATQGRALRRPS